MNTKPIFWRIALTVVLVLAAFSLQPHLARAATDPGSIPFVDRAVTIGDITYKYLVYVPAHLPRRKKVPVILFLHGSGERGDDNRIQTKNGVRLLIAQDVERFPCVVICPQCRPGVWWSAPEMAAMTLKELDQTMQEFHGDPQRLYLTGLSMGGYGTWYLARKYPGKWAALAPCCGGIVSPHGEDGQTKETLPKDPYFVAAQQVARIPVWVFHGEADPTVPVTESRQMTALLFALKTDLKYTEYPGVGHNSWDYAYKEPGLLPWLLAHRLAQ